VRNTSVFIVFLICLGVILKVSKPVLIFLLCFGFFLGFSASLELENIKEKGLKRVSGSGAVLNATFAVIQGTVLKEA